MMSGMKDLFGDQPYQLPSPPAERAFNGPEYVPDRDHKRLSGQIKRVFDVMKDARWRTFDQIAGETGDPAPSISAQLRHLRKTRFGSHTVERRHMGSGLYEYRLLVNRGGS
jgi:hypothetical protein